MGCKYDDYDWDELPKAVQEAAKVLGYTKAKWDGDQSIPADDKDWKELTEAEKAAATTLGYTQASWDSC